MAASWVRGRVNALQHSLRKNTRDGSEHTEGMRGENSAGPSTDTSMQASSNAGHSTVSFLFVIWALRHAAVGSIPVDIARMVWALGPSERCIANLFKTDPHGALTLLNAIARHPAAVRPLRHGLVDIDPGFINDGGHDVRRNGHALCEMRGNLCPRALGRVLAYDSVANGELTDGFFAALAVPGIPLLSMMRETFASIRLPPQAKARDEIIYAMAEQWYVANQAEAETPGPVNQAAAVNPFVDADNAFVFACSCLLLNSDLRSSVERKMSLADFVRSCGGTNAGTGIPIGFLKQAYQDIESFPLRAAVMPCDSPSMALMQLTMPSSD